MVVMVYVSDGSANAFRILAEQGLYHRYFYSISAVTTIRI